MILGNWKSKSSILNDIDILEEIINSNFSDNLIESTLSAAKIQCEYELNDNEWGYKDCNVSLKIPKKLGASKPLSIGDLKVQVKLEYIKGGVNQLGLLEDPLVEYQCELILSGYNKDLIDKPTIFSSWHFDKNIPSGPPKCIHPLYHLHFGGKSMTGSGYSFGDGILLEAPRIQYPPMDMILLVDFVLRNFYDKNEEPISDILNDSRYKEIVKNSQFRLWRPYYLTKSSPWHEEEMTINWNANEVLPWVDIWYN